MKKISVIIFTITTHLVFAQNNFKINTNSNVLTETCYHDPCSVSKSISTKIISKNSSQTVLKVRLLGGSREWESKKIEWNEKPHEIVIVCSKSKPRISIEGQTDIIPLNSNGVPGILYSSAELYFAYCHSTNMAVDKAIIKYNYNVKE